MSRWFDSRTGHVGVSLGKTVYSTLPQPTQLQKWVPSINKAVLRACALYAASCPGIYPWGDLNGFRVYRPARRGRSFWWIQDYKPNTFIFTFTLPAVSVSVYKVQVLGNLLINGYGFKSVLA